MKVIIFFILFFVFNTLHIDSNSSKRLIYNQKEIYDRNYNTIYFINTNTNNLLNEINDFDFEILSYIIEGKKYYAKDIIELEEIYLKDKNIEQKLLYEINGIKIDAINVLCTNEELIELEKIFKIY